MDDNYDVWIRIKSRVKCWERGEVESMIKFQHEIGAQNQRFSICDSSAPKGHWIRPRQWLWNHQHCLNWEIWKYGLEMYLRTMERDLMRPVPVVFLLLAWRRKRVNTPRSLPKWYFVSGLAIYHLDRPVVSPDLGCREAARGASLLLDVESHLKKNRVISWVWMYFRKPYRSTSPADCVRLVAPLSKGASSLGHLEASHHYSETCGLLEFGA